MIPLSNSPIQRLTSSHAPRSQALTWSTLYLCVNTLFIGHPFFLTMLQVRHLPIWFPGAAFLRTAKEWLATITEMADQPYNWVKREMA